MTRPSAQEAAAASRISRSIETLIKDASRTHPSARWLVYQEIAREHGDGFANVVKARVEEAEAKRGRKGGRA